jgi:7-carboxy-7-deazaguanine synthase
MSDVRKYARQSDRGALYPVSETFYSLQGEGYWTGTPAFFIRLAGCSVGCAWCDTDYKTKDVFGANELAELTCMHPTKHVVLTGGEPLDHNLSPLIHALKTKNLFIQLETSGKYPIPEGIDWVTCSPKFDPKSLVLQIGDECKVVYAWHRDWYPQLLKMQFKHFFLQPLELKGNTNVEDVVTYVKENPKWRLSLQTHKILRLR